MTDDLIQEARKRLDEGTPPEQIRTDFARRGVRDAVIDEVMAKAQGGAPAADSGTTSRGAFKRRSPLLVALLSLTIIYFVYWFHETNVELKQTLGDDSRPLLRTIGWVSGPFLLMIPWLITEWKHAVSVERATGGTNHVIVWILYSVFFPAAPYLIQRDLNAAAGE